MKRLFDVVIGGALLVVSGPVIGLGMISSRLSTGDSPIFAQERIGLHGRRITVYKLRTMRIIEGQDSTVSVAGDMRITPIGAWLRRLKVDELPQLWCVVCGSMSLVGPRPDVPGWADTLEGEDRIILSVRPGITGPASIRFKDEELILSKVSDPIQHNRDVIWPKKVELNKQYVQNWTLGSDLRYLVATVCSGTQMNGRQENPQETI